MGLWDWILGRPSTPEAFRDGALAGFLRRSSSVYTGAPVGPLQIRVKLTPADSPPREVVANLDVFYGRARRGDDTVDEAHERVWKFLNELMAGATENAALAKVIPRYVAPPPTRSAPPPKPDPVSLAEEREDLLAHVKPLVNPRAKLENPVVTLTADEAQQLGMPARPTTVVANADEVLRRPLRSKVFLRTYCVDRERHTTSVDRSDLARLGITEDELDRAAQANLEAASDPTADAQVLEISAEVASGKMLLGVLLRFRDELSSSRVFSARIRGFLRRRFPDGYHFAIPSRNVLLAYWWKAHPDAALIEGYHRDERHPLAVGMHPSADFLPEGSPEPPAWTEKTVEGDATSWKHLAVYALGHPEDEPCPETPAHVEAPGEVDAAELLRTPMEDVLVDATEDFLEDLDAIEREAPRTDANRAVFERIRAFCAKTRPVSVLFRREPAALAGDGTCRLRELYSEKWRAG